MADHSWDHAPLSLICDVWTKHGMCFTTTRLPICKDCAIESFHHSHDNRLHSLLIDETLRRIRIKDLIIIELLGAQRTCAIRSIDLDSVLSFKIDELLQVPTRKVKR